MASQQILLGSGGKKPFEGRFDKYGHWADANDNYTQTALTSSNTITHVTTKHTDGSWGNNDGSGYESSRIKTGSALVSLTNVTGSASLEDHYAHASLIQSKPGSYEAFEQIRPASSPDGTWQTVTSGSHLTVTHYTRDVRPTSGDIWENIACIFNADTGGQHAVGWGAVRSQASNASSNYPKVHVLLNRSGVLEDKEQGYNVTNNIDNFRYGHVVGSIKHNSAVMFKDQGGDHSGWGQYGGQPRHLAIQNFNLGVSSWEGGVTSPQVGVGDFAFVYSSAQNTHGHRLSGQFLGGKMTGSSNEQVECHYVGWYNNYSNGHDGARAQSYLFDNQNSQYSSKTKATDSLDLGSNGAPASGGYGIPVKCIYPHGLMHGITAGDSQIQPGFSPGQNKYVYLNIGANYGYSDTPVDCALRDENGGDEFSSICMIGKTASTFTFVALNLNSSALEMYTHDTANNTTGSKLANVSAYSSDDMGVIHSIHAVPFTNRLLVCSTGHVDVYKVE